ncbi:MAG: class I SAM-dependent methyltransferase [Thermoanaerobaculia bacterium]|nr:class I SAM-dependent methyltransferase [Thermoanaerobaculia bacterium]
MNPFAYDFGYGLLWNWAHAVPLVLFAGVAWLALRRSWSRWIAVAAGLVAVWALASLVVVQWVLRMNLPLELPTEAFLEAGPAEVLDVGAGSGRSSLMVLRSRPQARVVALDLYEGYFGIADNRPERLFANAERAGARDRIEARVGDMRHMPLASDSLDAAVSAYAIDHLDEEGVDAALAETRRVLRPGGELLLMVIHPDGWVRFAYPFFAHHGYFGSPADRQRWRTELTDAGFEIVEEGTLPATLYLVARATPATT